jgi:hypothetical protein
MQVRLLNSRWSLELFHHLSQSSSGVKQLVAIAMMLHHSVTVPEARADSNNRLELLLQPRKRL